MKVGLIYFTQDGEQLGNRIIANSQHEIIVFNKQNQTAKEFVKECFLLDGIIFVSAVGIAVRLIAPLIQSKEVDPAVVVIDEQGLHVIPILSGHLGGANELAVCLAAALGATPIITTATDLNNVFAVDVWSKKINCAIADIHNIKHISSALLWGESVGFMSDFDCSDDLPQGIVRDSTQKTGILVSTSETRQPFPITLHIIPRIITVGVGCKKHTDPEKFEEYVLSTLKVQDISLKAVRRMTSVDLKKEEDCIKLFCKKYNIDFTTYSAGALAEIGGEFTPSEFVRATTGVDNICERSACCQNDGGLLLKKQSRDGMTIAIAGEKWRCKF